MPSRVPLRRRLSNILAVRSVQDQRIRIIGDAGETVARVGDWVIMQDTYPIAVVAPADFPPPAFEIIQEGGLQLSRAECELLEQTVGLGTTRNARDLLQGMRRLASISIGNVNIPFTPGQIEELQHRAKKRGQTVEQAIKAVVDRINDELFWRG